MFVLFTIVFEYGVQIVQLSALSWGAVVCKCYQGTKGESARKVELMYVCVCTTVWCKSLYGRVHRHFDLCDARTCFEYNCSVAVTMLAHSLPNVNAFAIFVNRECDCPDIILVLPL